MQWARDRDAILLAASTYSRPLPSGVQGVRPEVAMLIVVQLEQTMARSAVNSPGFAFSKARIHSLGWEPQTIET